MQNIKEYLSYDQETGIFTWIKSPKAAVKINSTANSRDIKGYVIVNYKNKTYKLHRLAWYYVYGELPTCNIDHINEVKDDNRIRNLRLDVHNRNTQNVSKLQSNNSSGYRGVSWAKHTNKWLASIKIKGRSKNLGYYDTPEEAYGVYITAKRKYHPFWVENKGEQL